jgi:diguanylate cyclase (GGDEF)-like protein
MNIRRRRSIRLVQDPSEGRFAGEGRPKESRKPIVWSSVFIRLMALAWAGAIAAALVDEFGPVAHLPFVTAMGMTGLLVGASFLWTAPAKVEDIPASVDDDGARDGLTGLPTFNAFSRRLNDEFTRARRMGRRVAVVLIDVNNLTAVNREYGVRSGDDVLRHVAGAIEGTKRYNDIAGRLGDDEFGVILLDTGEDGVQAFIDRLEERLAREAAVSEVSGRSISLWAGICSGSAVSSPETTAPEAVLDAAVASLDDAKQERERRRRSWLTA